MNPIFERARGFRRRFVSGTRVVAACLVLFGCALPSWAAGMTNNIPLDWRCRILSSDFQKTAPGEWVSSQIQAPFPFEELIYSWHIQKPGDTFRLYLQASFGPNDDTEWLYAGFWGAVTDGVTNRQRPAFERGVLDLDFLKLKAKALAFRFKVVSAGTNLLAAPPALTVVTTDTRGGLPRLPAELKAVAGRVLDVPLRRQFNARGEWMKDRCQSAALASALEYYGKPLLLEDIVRFTNDPEYNYPGLWPRVIGAAREYGCEGYIERFRDWTAVRRTLAENKVILCSMRLKAGECKAPPYASMGNHIVVLCGVTDDGRVVVTDSALGKSGRGYLCQWLQSDFETVWMRAKGGVAMVICPPPRATEKTVKDLPAFAAERTFPTGDDH